MSDCDRTSLQFPDNTYTEIHTSDISASAQKTPAVASNKHIRTLLPLSQPRWQMQTSPRTSTFSGPLMIYLGKTECYLLGEMRRVLGEEWYGRCWEASVRQMKIFWCLKHPAGRRYCVCLSPQLPYKYRTVFWSDRCKHQHAGVRWVTGNKWERIRGRISSNAKPKAKQAEPSASLH